MRALLSGSQNHRHTADRAGGRDGNPIGPIRLHPPTPLKRAGLQAGGVQTFAITAFPNKLLFQSPQLPIKQVVGLVDQADQGVGHNRRVTVLQPGGVGARIRQIGPIRPIRPSRGEAPRSS